MSELWNRAIDKGFIETIIDNCRDIKKYYNSNTDSSTDYYAEIGKMLSEELYMTYEEDIEV